MPNAHLLAVASRDLGRARQFAERFGIELAFGSYQELFESPLVDVVYVATPHPEHRAIGMAALRAGKTVLIEKAFTTSRAAALDIADAARSRRRFAMEAMWTRFQPAVVGVRELIAAGAIGDVRSVRAQLGDVRSVRAQLGDVRGGQTLSAPSSVALCRGALLNLGPYPVSFAQMLLGRARQVRTRGTVLPTGLDAAAILLVDFFDGGSANITCSLLSPLSAHARVVGSRGWFDVPRFHHPDTLLLHRAGRAPETRHLPTLGQGYAHELIEVTDVVLEGRAESAVMPLTDSVAVMGILEDALAPRGALPRDRGHGPRRRRERLR